MNENRQIINELEAMLASTPAQILRYSVGSLPEPGKPFTVLNIESIAIKISRLNKNDDLLQSLNSEKIKVTAVNPVDAAKEVVVFCTVSDSELDGDLLLLKFSPPARVAIFEKNPWLGSDGSIDLDYYDSYEAHVDEYEILSRFEGSVGTLYTPAESPSILVSYTKIELLDIKPEHLSFFKRGTKISGRSSLKEAIIQPFSGSRSYSTEIKVGFEDREFSATVISAKMTQPGRLTLEIEGFVEELFGETPSQNLAVPKK